MVQIAPQEDVMSSLHAPPDPAVDSIIRSPWPAPPVPETDLTSFVLRHAARLADQPGADRRRERARAELRRAGRRRRARGGAGSRARGFGRGDVLALHLPNLPEFPLALHAGLRAGGIVTPASPLFTVARARRPAAARAGAACSSPRARSPRPRRRRPPEAGVEEVLVLGEAPGLTPFAG